MSEVKKIQIDGVSYDLGGGSGLSDDAKNALLDCFNHVAWIDEDGQQYVDALSAALFDNTWSVTNTLTNATTSNPSATVTKDGIYSATISASVGYTLEGATVSVTMNGADITSSVYDDGDILIPAVTGDVVITVVAVALTVESISAVYTQSGTVYDTDSLDSLKADLVVTATMPDSSTVIVPSTDYTLSGTLTVGTSTITVAFAGETDTFTVTVTSSLERVDGAYLIYDARDITSATWSPRVGSISATINGATKTDNTLLFDGTDDEVHLDNNISLSGTAQTFQFYLKLNDLTKTNIVFTQNAQTYAVIVANMRPQESIFRVFPGQNANFSYTFDNHYHLFTVIIRSNSVSLYVDETLINTISATKNLSYDTSKFYVSAPVFSNYISANVQAIMIYDKELSASEISQNYAYQHSIMG